jgi:uncharacterized protein YndB with AHSA1/START domain
MNFTFRNEVQIAASPEAVYSFFDHLPENYTSWHPDHLGFRWIAGNCLSAGVIAEVDHILGGKARRLPTKFTAIVPNKRIELEWGDPNGSFFAPHDSWAFEATTGGCRFVSECELVVTGDSSLSKKIDEALAVVRKHLAEEVKNLKRIVEGMNNKS